MRSMEEKREREYVRLREQGEGREKKKISERGVEVKGGREGL